MELRQIIEAGSQNIRARAKKFLKSIFQINMRSMNNELVFENECLLNATLKRYISSKFKIKKIRILATEWYSNEVKLKMQQVLRSRIHRSKSLLDRLQCVESILFRPLKT